MRPFLILALSALLVFAAGSLWIALYPPLPLDLGGAPNFDDRAEKVRIPVADDALDGWLLHGQGRGLIVAFSGYGRDHHREWRYAQFFHRAGYDVLTVDFRSARATRRKPTTLGAFELEDARAIFEWIAHRPGARPAGLGLFGESLGGSVALLVAAERPEIEAIVVDSPFESGECALIDATERWAHLPSGPLVPIERALGALLTGHDPGRLDVRAAARRLRGRPLFVIASGCDNRLAPAQAEHLCSAAESADSVWCVADAGHTNAWVLHRAEYERRVLAFYARHAGSSRRSGTPAAALVAAPGPR